MLLDSPAVAAARNPRKSNKRMQTRRSVPVRRAGHSADGIGVVSSVRVNGLMSIFAFGRTRSI